MEFVNATRMLAGYSVGLEPSGRELLVIAVKGSFVLPKPGEEVRLHEEQVPLVMSDTFTGEPGLSAPMYEVDFAPRKSACDVLLLGSAHAPDGRPATRVPVRLRVDVVDKCIEVVGDRAWDAGATGIRTSPPKPFVRQAISYDYAFGGVDFESDDTAEHDAYMPNPIGRGFRRNLRAACVDGRPLPNTEEPGRPVRWPSDKYRPMAFGPIGRSWSARLPYAGTYDQKWLDEVFPFLPGDFDVRYYQAAPADQQLPFPMHPLEVTLTSLTPDGTRRFVIPAFRAPVYVFPKRGEREDYMAKLDTIVLEPDLERFTLTWRVTRPLRDSMFELSEVFVGKMRSPSMLARRGNRAPIPVTVVATGSEVET